MSGTKKKCSALQLASEWRSYGSRSQMVESVGHDGYTGSAERMRSWPRRQADCRWNRSAAAPLPRARASLRSIAELVLGAFNRGESPEGIVRSFLALADVYAVLSRYLADPVPFDRYLQNREQEADAVRRQLDDAGVVSRVGKQELLRRARAKGLHS